jgi:hypothetical protein
MGSSTRDKMRPEYDRSDFGELVRGKYADSACESVGTNVPSEEPSTVVPAELDAETRFRVRAARSSPEQGLQLLDELDRATPGSET